MIDSQLHWHRKRGEADGTEDYDGARVSRLGLQLMGTEHPASATPAPEKGSFQTQQALKQQRPTSQTQQDIKT